MPHTLILLRHGQSEWNLTNLFTGWVDVGLTEQGRREAARAGELLASFAERPDVVFTSVLKRAIHTANLALEVAGRDWLPVERSWRLNERHYGALQGLNKPEVLAEFGEAQFMAWRRSFDVAPPPLDDASEWSQYGDERYAGLGDELPRTENLKLVVERLMPYWHSDIVPAMRSGRTPLVVAHGNSLRALIKQLDEVSDDDIAELNLPTGVPLVYELDDAMRPVSPAYYLDPEAARAGVAEVAAQGKK